MKNEIFANRLITARKIRCMSQRELARALNGQISASAIEKYEKGTMLPSSKILLLLAKALDMNIDYFFRPFTVTIDMSKFEFRKTSMIGVKRLEAIKLFIYSEIEKYIEIESIIGGDVTFTLNYADLLIQNDNDAKLLAMRLRKDLNIGLDAIVSVVDLLESCGIKIIEIDEDVNFSGTCNMANTIPIIVINKNMTSERMRLTILHELAHLLMNCPNDIDKERFCNVFANEMLIPSSQFVKIIGNSRHDISLVELRAIQKEYGISVDALMAKAAQLKVISSNRYATYYKKKNAIPELKSAIDKSVYPMEKVNRYECLVYRALASDIISSSKAASLLNMPISSVLANLNLM